MQIHLARYGTVVAESCWVLVFARVTFCIFLHFLKPSRHFQMAETTYLEHPERNLYCLLVFFWVWGLRISRLRTSREVGVRNVAANDHGHCCGSLEIDCSLVSETARRWAAVWGTPKFSKLETKVLVVETSLQKFDGKHLDWEEIDGLAFYWKLLTFVWGHALFMKPALTPHADVAWFCNAFLALFQPLIM